MATLTARGAWAAWALSRAFVVGVGTPLVALVPNDVRYYWEASARWHEVGTAATLIEYPTPVVWLMQLPWTLGLGSYPGYVVVFAAAMFGLDFAFARRISRDEHGPVALLAWTLLVTAIGPIAYLRFDIATAVLAGWALLSGTRRRTDVGASLLAMGAAIKLWPALLWPALLVGKASRNWRTTAWFWGVGAVLAFTALVGGGWTRLFTPLRWQTDRGLQVEAVFATVPMLGRAFVPDTWSVRLTQWQAWEVFGPGVEHWITLTTVLTAAGLVFVILCYAGWLRRPERTYPQAVVLMVTVITLMIVTNKTFSPQYLLWLAGPLTAGVALTPTSDPLSRHLRGMAAGVLALSLVTLTIYPFGYDAIMRLEPETAAVTVMLALRNLATCALLGWLMVLMYRLSWPKRNRRA